MKVRAGAFVEIYEDPITEENREGIAQIMCQYPGDYDELNNLYLAKVRFVGTNDVVVRRFKARNVIAGV